MTTKIQSELDQKRVRRNHQNAQRRAEKRRLRMLRALAVAVGAGAEFVGESLTDQESLALLTAHLNRSQRIATRLIRTAQLARSFPALVVPASGKSIARPKRTLHVKNRARISPGLLKTAVDIEFTLPLTDSVIAARELAESGSSPHVVLDCFMRASQLPAEIAAAVLEKRGIRMGFSVESAKAVSCARAFWDQYSSGRAAFASAVAAAEMPVLAGDWALFESQDLAALLPGLRVPRLLTRRTYLANLVSTAEELCLDIHSFPSALPLFRHPFRA